MGPQKRKAGARRLADMNAAEPEQPWIPEVDPDGEEATYRIYIEEAPERASYLQRMVFNARNQVVEWAIVQMRKDDGGRWRRVALYDICHGKGLHIHLYDRHEKEFTQVPLRPVNSQRDVEPCLDYAEKRVRLHWQDNERRSDHGQ